MERLSWLFYMGSKCNHIYPYKREAEGDLTHRKGGGNVTMMEELGVMQPHQAKELWQPPEPGRGKKRIHLLRECGLLTH